MATINSGPEPVDWNVYAGDANEETVIFQAGQDPWDITGAVIEAQARVTALDPAVALTATCTVVDAVNGEATIAWDGEAVRTLLAGADTWEGEYDVQILEQGKTLPRSLWRGKMTARYDVTRTP